MKEIVVLRCKVAALLLALIIMGLILNHCKKPVNHIVVDPGPDVIVRYPQRIDTFIIHPGDSVKSDSVIF